jgi:hypothetical protein
MIKDKQRASSLVFARGIATVALAAALSGCAMHKGDGGMQMGAMDKGPMHQMMEDMGCAHPPSGMAAMAKLTPTEKQAHMKAHMQECKAKMRQQATEEALARIDTCVEQRLGGKHHGRHMSKTKLREMMIADVRACASQEKAAPSDPKSHDGHH